MSNVTMKTVSVSALRNGDTFRDKGLWWVVVERSVDQVIFAVSEDESVDDVWFPHEKVLMKERT